jgi:hypothetical protein
MEAAGRNPERSTVIIFFNSRPGWNPGYEPRAIPAFVARMEAAGRNPGAA